MREAAAPAGQPESSPGGGGRGGQARDEAGLQRSSRGRQRSDPDSTAGIREAISLAAGLSAAPEPSGRTVDPAQADPTDGKAGRDKSATSSRDTDLSQEVSVVSAAGGAGHIAGSGGGGRMSHITAADAKAAESNRLLEGPRGSSHAAAQSAAAGRHWARAGRRGGSEGERPELELADTLQTGGVDKVPPGGAAALAAPRTRASGGRKHDPFGASAALARGAAGARSGGAAGGGWRGEAGDSARDAVAFL